MKDAAAAVISLTGFNQDLIAEAGATNPQTGTTTNFSGWVFNERGAPSQPATRGFPTGGMVTTADASSNPGSTFQLAAFSAGNNVLSSNTLQVALADLPTARQLTFAAAQQIAYQDLQFFTVNQGAGAGTSWNAILVFSDASTSTYTIATNRPDWTVAPAASQLHFNNNGLVSRNDTDWSTANYTSGIYIYEDRLTLAAADQIKTLVGVRFDVTATTGVGLAVFAINGTQTIPEPTTWLALTGIGFSVVLLRRHHKNRSFPS